MVNDEEVEILIVTEEQKRDEVVDGLYGETVEIDEMCRLQLETHQLDDGEDIDDVHYIEMVVIEENLTVDIVVIGGDMNEYDDRFDDDNID